MISAENIWKNRQTQMMTLKNRKKNKSQTRKGEWRLVAFHCWLLPFLEGSVFVQAWVSAQRRPSKFQLGRLGREGIWASDIYNLDPTVNGPSFQQISGRQQ